VAGAAPCPRRVRAGRAGAGGHAAPGRAAPGCARVGAGGRGRTRASRWPGRARAWLRRAAPRPPRRAEAGSRPRRA